MPAIASESGGGRVFRFRAENPSPCLPLESLRHGKMISPMNAAASPEHRPSTEQISGLTMEESTEFAGQMCARKVPDAGDHVCYLRLEMYCVIGRERMGMRKARIGFFLVWRELT
jgi:hypothetical protein